MVIYASDVPGARDSVVAIGTAERVVSAMLKTPGIEGRPIITFAEILSSVPLAGHGYLMVNPSKRRAVRIFA